MYKIITKMHTLRNGIGRYHMVPDENGNLIEFATDDKEQAKSEALKILKKVGYNDLRIVDEQDFYIEIENVIDNNITDDDISEAEKILGNIGYEDLYLTNDADYNINLIWGKKHEETTPTYTVRVEATTPIVVTPSETEVEEHGNVEVMISSAEKMRAYHLVINGEECIAGIPDWIEFELLDEYSDKAILKDITQDYTIVVVPDVE